MDPNVLGIVILNKVMFCASFKGIPITFCSIQYSKYSWFKAKLHKLHKCIPTGVCSPVFSCPDDIELLCTMKQLDE